MNPYHKARDRALRKAEKQYRRAVENHYMGLWLDEVVNMSKEVQSDVNLMHDSYLDLISRKDIIESWIDNRNKETSDAIVRQK